MRKPKKSKYELALDSAEKKVDRILQKAFGERAGRVGWGVPGTPVMYAVEAAFANEMSEKRVQKFGFDMGDWGRDAGKMLVLHLFLERFSREEIEALIRGILVHVPYHIKTAAASISLSPAEQVDEFIKIEKAKKAKRRTHTTKRKKP